VVERETGASAADRPSWRPLAARVEERVAVAAEEVVDGFLRVSPAVLTSDELERGSEAHEIDDERSPPRIGEIGEAATEARDRVLLDVRIAVQARLRQASPHVVEQPAHGFDERTVHESEVVVRRLAQARDERRAGQ
jgi:hypothetical protein